MSLYAMADNNIEIPTKRDAVLYNAALGDEDFVFGGVGNELSCNASNLLITLNSGEGVVQGRHITCEGTETLQLSANSSGYIVLRYDLTQSLGNELYLAAVPLVVQNDLNNSGTIRDLPLYSYTTNGTTATLTDVRNIFTSILEKLGTQVNYSLNGTVLTITTKD